MAKMPGLVGGRRSARRPSCPTCRQSDQAARLGDAWYCARCQKTTDHKGVHIELPVGVKDTRVIRVADVLPRRDRRRAGMTHA